MNDHDRSSHQPEPSGFWKSRTGIALIAFLIIAGLLLAYEHRVHIFFSGYGVLIVLLTLCVGMHLFMHGGHGGHGGHGDGDGDSNGGARP